MKIVINSIVLIIAIVVGMIINMLIVKYGVLLISNPEGYDNTSMEAMQNTFHLLQPKHYVIPWLAHAFGAFTGALIVFNFSKSNMFYLALSVCVLFFIGGVIMVVALPSPIWFTVLDLGFAYLPMAWLVKKQFNFRRV